MILFRWYFREAKTGGVEHVYPFLMVNPSDPGAAYFTYDSGEPTIGMDATATQDFDSIYTEDRKSHDEKKHGMIHSLFFDLPRILEMFEVGA